MDCKHVYFGVALISIFSVNSVISLGEAERKSKQLVIKNKIEGPELKSGNGNNYTLEYKHLADVHLDCEKVDYSPTDTLKWKIAYGEQTSCEDKQSKKIHYINRLGKKHDQAILTCEDNSKHFTTIKMICKDCPKKDVNKNLLYLNCLGSNETDPAPIVTFINGESKSLKERIHKFKFVKNTPNTTVHCQSENGEVFWDWDKSTIPQEDTQPIISGDDNIVGLTIRLTEAMDQQTLFCTNKELHKSVKITFELTSDVFIVINNSRTSYGKLMELPYQTSDSVTLECKAIIDTSLKYTVGVYWSNDSEFSKQCSGKVARPKVQQDVTCYLPKLTPADDGKNITCQLGHIQKEPQLERVIVFKYQKVTTTQKYDETTEGSFKDTTDHDNRNGTELNPVIIATIVTAIGVIIVIIIVVICIKYRPGSNTVTVSYKNMQEPTDPGPKEESTYARPVDQYEYSYAIAPGEQRSQPQYAYSTPFVPTLNEMYAQPMKKGKETPDSATLAKYQNLPNTLKGVQNQPDPGYSSVSGGNSDTSSETYMYSRIK